MDYMKRFLICVGLITLGCTPGQSNYIGNQTQYMSSVASEVRQARTPNGTIAPYFIVEADSHYVAVLDENRICPAGKLEELVSMAYRTGEPIQFSGIMSPDMGRIILTVCPFSSQKMDTKPK